MIFMVERAYILMKKSAHLAVKSFNNDIVLMDISKKKLIVRTKWRLKKYRVFYYTSDNQQTGILLYYFIIIYVYK